ncbi:MAG: acylneuraminate cytidylyltransferase family protein [Sedimenticola sp.]
MKKITAFLPCRKGSERVKNKNTRCFCGVKHGLVEIKLRQLSRCEDIDSIIVSTDDNEVRDIALELKTELGSEISIIMRPPQLATSKTRTDDLIKYVPDLIDTGSVLWTHVTSPFVDENIYTTAIRKYKKNHDAKLYDSLMSVNTIQTFLWNENGPLNYDRAKEKWPRTQTLPIWYEINSAIFIAPIEMYKDRTDRIGERPCLFKLSYPASIDIDVMDQFVLAESVWKTRFNG